MQLAMDQRETRARAIQAAIRDVLLNHWDPIGVAGDPAAQDEYDAYVGGVYRVLASGAGAVEVAEHLAGVEQEFMGLATSPSALLAVAQRLCAIDVTLNGVA
ncbi:MAG: hypothetical protein AB7U83_17430 [Vicinamibacterales bacterium]